ncbi:perilipin-3 isoform X3 [Microcaecilia unicolor]|uniref:Perilipin n=1 Tax=Microcaecilia unicolor TaxID=1415580 RepID=A0A6P7ZBY0_9AMPH|nr:perilipin-3-like isoform X3 [Microcaecilia unicolor]
MKSNRTMASNENGSDKPTAPESEEQPTVVARVASLPLLSSAYNAVSSAYASTKETHPYIKSVCDVAEKGVKTITAAAVSGAQPILSKLEPQLSTANEYACKGLNKLEEKLPILQQPTDKVVADTKELVAGAKDVVSSRVAEAKDAVSSRVTGVMDMAKGAVTGSVEMTKAAVTSSVNTVMGSKVGQLVSSGVDTVLGKSEEWVDHYLPMTDEELAALASSVEGFEGASLQQQKSEQSYFVRLGSLSSKVRHRAYQHSLGKIDMAKQSIHGGQEKMQKLWTEWSKKQAGGTSADTSVETEHIESQALAMTRTLTQQLQGTCLTLVSSVQGLPANIQEKAQQLRQTAEELHHSFSTAHTFQDLSSTVLMQSRERVNRAREYMDELLNYVVANTPLTWLVGPFAPQLVERPATPEEQEMEKIK